MVHKGLLNINGNEPVWQVGGGDKSTFLSTKPTAK